MLKMIAHQLIKPTLILTFLFPTVDTGRIKAQSYDKTNNLPIVQGPVHGVSNPLAGSVTEDVMKEFLL